MTWQSRCTIQGEWDTARIEDPFLNVRKSLVWPIAKIILRAVVSKISRAFNNRWRLKTTRRSSGKIQPHHNRPPVFTVNRRQPHFYGIIRYARHFFNRIFCIFLYYARKTGSWQTFANNTRPPVG